MEVHVARSRRNPFGGNIIPFLLVFAIGFSAGYIWRSATEDEALSPDAPEQAAAPVGHPAEPEPDPAEAVEGGRHLFVPVAGAALDAASASLLGHVRPAGVLLQEDNLGAPEAARGLARAIKEAAGGADGFASMPYIAVAQEGGDHNVLGLDEAPAARQIGQGGDAAAARDIGGLYARAGLDHGAGVLFGPVLDVYIDGGVPGFQSRSFGDAGVAGEMGEAFIEGVQGQGVIPVVKYYPGYGAAQDQGEGTPVLEGGAEEIALNIFAFYDAISRGAPGVLAGHVAVPALDVDHPDRPASFSPVMIREVIREQWGYDGVIIADDLMSPAATAYADPAEGAVLALEAGCDAVLIDAGDPETVRQVAAAVEAAVAEGRLSAEALRESRRRLQAWEERLSETQLPGFQFAEIEPAFAGTPSLELDMLAAGDALEEPPSSMPPEPFAAEPEAVAVEEEEDVAEEPSPFEAEDLAAPEEAPETDAPEAVEEETPPGAPDGGPIRHEVEPGEYLSHIASRYGVSLNDLVEWNDLPSTDVQSGQTLTVYPPGGTPPPARDPAPQPEPEAETVAPATPPPGSETIEYVVQPGDTLTRIANNFGVSTQDISAWNDLNGDNILHGFPLTIHVPPGALPSDTEAAPAPGEPADTRPAGAILWEHRVHEGETVEEIAEAYRVPASDVRAWNGGVDTVSAGDTLTIYLPAAAGP